LQDDSIKPEKSWECLLRKRSEEKPHKAKIIDNFIDKELLQSS